MQDRDWYREHHKEQSREARAAGLKARFAASSPGNGSAVPSLRPSTAAVAIGAAVAVTAILGAFALAPRSPKADRPDHIIATPPAETEHAASSGEAQPHEDRADRGLNPLGWLHSPLARTPEVIALPPLQEAPFPASGTIEYHDRAAFDPSTTTVDVTYAPIDARKLVLRFEDWNSRRPLLTIYLRPGGTVSFPLPPGAYRIHQAIGSSWFGPKLLFGGDMIVSESADPYLIMPTQPGVTARQEIRYGPTSGDMRMRPSARVEF